MFWELLPIYHREHDPEHFDELNLEILAVMEAQLYMGSCRIAESGLHGLGHWIQYGFREAATKIMDRFLLSSSPLVQDLRGFAEVSLSGKMM